MQFKFRQLWALLFFFMLTVILFHNGYGSQFLDDFFTILVYFRQQGWSGFYDSYGFTSLYYGHNFINLSAYSLFGLNKMAWYLLFTGLHSLNAFLGFIFFSQLFQKNNLSNAKLMAFLGSLMFLLAPYQTENVIWGATLHYAISFLCLWACLMLLALYLDSGKWRHLFLSHLLFAFALLTLELSLVYPAIFFVVFGFLWPPFEYERLKQIVLKIMAPNACIIVIYFLLTKFIKGHFIGHYGSEVHLANLGLSNMASAFLKYVVKLVFFIHHFSFYARGEVYGFFDDHPVVSAIAFLLLAISSVAAFVFNRRKIFLATALFLSGFAMLLPVLNMYFAYMFTTENERLSYIASYFIYLAIILLFSYTGKLGMLFLALGFIATSSYLLHGSTESWKGASQVQKAAVDSFRWEDADRIFVLNQPCYFRGVYVFRNKTRLNRALYIMRDIDIQTNIREIAWANMNSFADSVLVEKRDGRALKVTLPNWGRWFWYNNLGAADYENDYCKVDFSDDGQSYVVEFKDLSPFDTVICYTPNGWREIRLY